MGLTHVTAEISNLGKTGDKYEAEFLVDTGAIDCMAPTNSLKEIGVEVQGKDVYELASGDTIEYRYGFARIAFLGDETVSRVIFGPEDCEPLIGVVTLESMGIGVDPVTMTLKRMAAKPLK
jgi:clan AA aspartic protease